VGSLLRGALARTPNSHCAKEARAHCRGQLGNPTIECRASHRHRCHGIAAKHCRIAAVTGQVVEEAFSKAQFLAQFACRIAARLEETRPPQGAEARKGMTAGNPVRDRAGTKGREQLDRRNTTTKIIQQERIDPFVGAIQLRRGAEENGELFERGEVETTGQGIERQSKPGTPGFIANYCLGRIAGFVVGNQRLNHLRQELPRIVDEVPHLVLGDAKGRQILTFEPRRPGDLRLYRLVQQRMKVP
jgi:hypothetical protein